MAEEVEMIPVTDAEPPKANPLAKPAAPRMPTPASSPIAQKPAVGGAALKPGIKLPPKPGATVSALRPGLKLPTQNALRPGLKLPTQTALKPGIKLPPKPVIRKPGATVAAMPLPKPLAPANPAAGAEPKPQEPASPASSVQAKPLESLKSVTQKLKSITQEVPQQAILHRTGIIAEGSSSEMQKEAAKHKTARISLSDAMGVAPVKDEAAPMKTIRIKRPINIPGSTSSLTPPERPAPAPAAPAEEKAPEAPKAAAEPTVTQRKTLKISRPNGVATRPGGKFGIKRPSSAAAPQPASGAAPTDKAPDAVAEIPDIPANVPAYSAPAAAPVSESPAWVWTLSAIVQFAACVAIGVLVWFLYENSQLPTFCGGLGWGA